MSLSLPALKTERSFSCQRRVRIVLVARLCCRFTLAALSPNVGAGSEPPSFPDAAHVNQGCFISAMAYVARFVREFPGEQAAAITVNPAGFDGAHTLVIVTWRGDWWARDEYSGVFSLHCRSSRGEDPERVRQRAETELSRIASRQLKAGRIHPATARRAGMTAGERRRNVEVAASLVPEGSRRYWLRCDGRELPFLYFVPSPGRVALYDPETGTATAECVPTDVAALVGQVADRLGYRVTGAARADATSGSSRTLTSGHGRAES